MTKSVHIDYYAALREQRGCAAESVETGATTPRELYAELRLRHRLALGPEVLQVAVNDECAPWDVELRSGDRLVFMAPVAGG